MTGRALSRGGLPEAALEQRSPPVGGLQVAEVGIEARSEMFCSSSE